MEVGLLRRLRRVLFPRWLLPAHLLGFTLREVDVHDLVLHVGDVRRGDIELAREAGPRGDDVVLACALDGAQAAPVIADDCPTRLQVRHAHARSTSLRFTRAYGRRAARFPPRQFEGQPPERTLQISRPPSGPASRAL